MKTCSGFWAHSTSFNITWLNSSSTEPPAFPCCPNLDLSGWGNAKECCGSPQQEPLSPLLWQLGLAVLHLLHPWSLTWNLKINPWKRRCLLEIIIFRFHVKLWRCIYLFHLCSFIVSLKTEVYDCHSHSKPTRERSEVMTAQAQHLRHARMSPWQINAGKRSDCRMRRWGHLAWLGDGCLWCKSWSL